MMLRNENIDLFDFWLSNYEYCNLNHTIIRMNNRFVQIFAVNGFKANGICIILNCIQIYTISLRSSNVRKCVCLMVLGFKSLPISFDLSRNITGSVRIYHCISLKKLTERWWYMDIKMKFLFSPPFKIEVNTSTMYLS